jgi:hypothetical protein
LLFDGGDITGLFIGNCFGREVVVVVVVVGGNVRLVVVAKEWLFRMKIFP